MGRHSDFERMSSGATAAGEEIVAVLLDSDIYAATRDGYPDLRIFDDRGSQVPYTRFMDIRNRDIEFGVNDYRQLKLVVEQELDDRESPLRALVRGRKEGQRDRQVEITQRERRPFRIDGVELWRVVERESAKKVEAVRYPPVGFQVEQNPKRKETQVEIESRREPLTRITIGTASRNFSRTARVLIPAQRGVRTDWVEVGRGTLSLIQFRAFRHAELKVDFPEQRQEHYRVVIENEDNPPLEVTAIEAEGTPYRLVFLAAQGRSYRVEYCSDTAESPKYDTAAVLAALSRGYEPVTVTLAPQVANPGYRAGRGFGAILSSTVFLVVAISLMVLALAWALFRAGQSIKNLPQDEV